MKRRTTEEFGRSAVETAKEQYGGFSRSTRILVIVGAVSMLLLVIIEGWAVAEGLHQQTDGLLAQMDDARTAKSSIRPSLRDQVRSLGEIRLPDAALRMTEAEQRLKSTVDRILAENDAENESSDVSPGSYIGSNKLPEIPRGPGRRLAKIGLRVKFDCPQDKVTSIISSMEANPEIYSINRLQLLKYDDGQEYVRQLVNVELTLESWVLGPATSGGRG